MSGWAIAGLVYALIAFVAVGILRCSSDDDGQEEIDE